MIKNVWLYSVRYALTRNTGAMLQVASEIIENIEMIPIRERKQIKAECIDHIEMYGNSYGNKGEIEDVISVIIKKEG